MTVTTTTPEPHVAERIEPGAILYSSWGYDQTNIDFYYVVRATEKSAWIVPMSKHSSGEVNFMAEYVTPKEPVFFEKCECRHYLSGHQSDGPCHMHGCECTEIRPVALKPSIHRINRYSDSESLKLASYAYARLWDGSRKYATHYA